jgi:hypothetical protein
MNYVSILLLFTAFLLTRITSLRMAVVILTAQSFVVGLACVAAGLETGEARLKKGGEMEGSEKGVGVVLVGEGRSRELPLPLNEGRKVDEDEDDADEDEDEEEEDEDEKGAQDELEGKLKVEANEGGEGKDRALNVKGGRLNAIWVAFVFVVTEGRLDVRAVNERVMGPCASVCVCM